MYFRQNCMSGSFVIEGWGQIRDVAMTDVPSSGNRSFSKEVLKSMNNLQ